MQNFHSEINVSLTASAGKGWWQGGINKKRCKATHAVGKSKKPEFHVPFWCLNRASQQTSPFQKGESILRGSGKYMYWCNNKNSILLKSTIYYFSFITLKYSLTWFKFWTTKKKCHLSPLRRFHAFILALTKTRRSSHTD